MNRRERWRVSDKQGIGVPGGEEPFRRGRPGKSQGLHLTSEKFIGARGKAAKAERSYPPNLELPHIDGTNGNPILLSSRATIEVYAMRYRAESS